MTSAAIATRRVRVLLASRDARFRHSATAVLGRHGHLVESTDRSSRLPELIGRMRPNVVVVDASESPRPLAHALAVVSCLNRPIGLLVVADAEAPWTEGLASVRKADALETLPAEIEQAYMDSRDDWRAVAALS
jgi:AmiR/NasT family two-component response regulator